MSAEKAKKQCCGVVSAVPTPFRQDRTLDLEALAESVEFQVSGGLVTGDGVLLVCGAGGEYMHMTLEERREVARAAVNAAAGRVPVFVGASHTSTMHAVQAARDAEAAGATGIQISLPYYFVLSEEEAFDFFRTISEAVEIGLLVYNDPWASGLDIGPGLLEHLAELENIVALKWSKADPYQWSEVYQRFADRFSIVDNQIVATRCVGWMLGARGFVSQVANFAPEYEMELLRRLRAGDWEGANKQMERLLLPYYRWLVAANQAGITGEGNFIKAAQALVGLRGGYSRPPHREVPEEWRERLRAILREAERR